MPDSAAPHPALADVSRPAARADLLGFLDQLGIAHRTLDHPPIFTVEEGREHKLDLPGGHTKNLFLKDKRGALFLISALADTQIRLNRTHTLLGSARLSFGSAKLLYETLGVRPGSVTAFSVMNDREGRVTMALDAALLEHDLVNFHPLTNDATTAIAKDDLLAFLDAVGHTPLIVDFTALTEAET